MPTFNSPLTYIGTGNELPAIANIGDIFAVDGTLYVYCSGWEELAPISESFTINAPASPVFDGTILILDN